MKRCCFVIGLFMMVILSCEKDNFTDLKITTGTVCGWCGGADSLFISEKHTHYEYLSPCDTNDLSGDEVTDRSDWNELTDLLDINEFEKIHLNTCYSCVDGCDTWICIEHGSKSHQIRFAEFDSVEIREIRPFVDKLNAIREKTAIDLRNH